MKWKKINGRLFAGGLIGTLLGTYFLHIVAGHRDLIVPVFGSMLTMIVGLILVLGLTRKS